MRNSIVVTLRKHSMFLGLLVTTVVIQDGEKRIVKELCLEK